MKEFRNLIFDIGDVLIHLDFKHTFSEFQKLAAVDFAEIISHSREHQVFERFEKGAITAQQFRHDLKQFLKPSVSDEEINTAWNSVLHHYPEDKFTLLKELKSRYKTFALSNTNEIHVATFNKAVRAKFGEDNFESFFHRAYYSNEVGYRKPEIEIYEFVLSKENLIPSETFFVDDLPENIEVAKTLGIRAHLLTDRNKLQELLEELNII